MWRPLVNHFDTSIFLGIMRLTHIVRGAFYAKDRVMTHDVGWLVTIRELWLNGAS